MSYVPVVGVAGLCLGLASWLRSRRGVGLAQFELGVAAGLLVAALLELLQPMIAELP